MVIVEAGKLFFFQVKDNEDKNYGRLAGICKEGGEFERIINKKKHVRA